MLSREDGALILLREHVAGIEDEAEIGGMSCLLYLREDDVCRWSIILVFNRPCTSAPVPGETEILPRCGDAVHFSGTLIVAHTINLIVIRPERLVLGVEVHADGIAQPDCVNLPVLP